MAILIWTNMSQPDEGNEMTNTADFLLQDEARRAAIALTLIKVASSALVLIVDDVTGKGIARFEYVNGVETMIFDDRVEPLFKLHGKLGS